MDSGTSSKSAIVSVAAILLSGLAINWASGLYEPTAPVLLIVSVVALVLAFAAQNQGAVGGPGSSRRANFDLARFALVAVVLGALVGAAWVLPIGPSVTYDGIWGMTPFANYELGAATCVALLGVIAVWRRAPLPQAAVFVTAAVTGMTLVLTIAMPVNELFLTIAGWAAYAMIIVGIAAVLPDAARLMGSFLGGGIGAVGENSATPEPAMSEGDTAPPEADAGVPASGLSR